MEGFTKALILSSENRVDLQRRFEIIGQSVKLPWQAESAFKVLSNVNITSTHVASAIKGFTDGLSNPTEKNHISQAVLFEAALIGALGVYSN